MDETSDFWTCNLGKLRMGGHPALSQSPQYLVHFNSSPVSLSKAKFQREERPPPGVSTYLA